jgi:L-threonate 2-dehydrogenase
METMDATAKTVIHTARMPQVYNLRAMKTDDQTEQVGVIGLGIMGGAFAGHLAAAGVPTFGSDLLQPNLDAFGAQGGHGRRSAREVGAEAGIVITSLPQVKALEEALFGSEGLVAARRPGSLLVETSTLPLEAKEAARARLAEAGIGMLDAPVSGTGSQARVKDIAVFASGERDHFERARGVLSHFARSVHHVGAFGAGSKLKYVANLLIAVHTAAAAEALVLAEKAGLDLGMVVDLLIDSAATSRMLEVRGRSMASRAYATPLMKVDVFQKDLDIIGGFARQSGCAAPLFSSSVPLYTAAGSQHMGGFDIGAVIAVLRQMAGL